MAPDQLKIVIFKTYSPGEKQNQEQDKTKRTKHQYENKNYFE